MVVHDIGLNRSLRISWFLHPFLRDLGYNNLTTLPDGVFGSLTALTFL